MEARLNYDVVIIGAGPAGSTLSYFLGKEGSLRVLVIEQRGWDTLWSKPCGNAIGKHHFTQLNLPEPRREEILQEVRGAEVISPKEDIVLTIKGEGYIIERGLLGKRMMREAVNNGIEFYPRSRAIKPVLENGFVRGVEAEIGGSRKIIRCNVLVDASGTVGVIKRQLPPNWPVSEPLDPRDTDVAFRERVLLENEIENPYHIKIYLDQNVAPGGYWWFFPEGTNRANVGLGVQGGVGNPSPKKLYEEKILSRPEMRGRKVLNAGGAVVPTRRPLDSLVWNGIIIIGDAAYTVNPVHGGGMGYAMIAAFWAHKAIIEAFEKGDYTAKGLWKLNTGYMRGIGAKQASLELTRIFMQKLGNQGLQFVMEKKLVSEDDVDLLSRKGELNESVAERATRVLTMILKAARAAFKPGLLMKLKTLSDYMRTIKRHYEKYPEDPEELEKWSREAARIRESFLNSIR